MQKHPPLAHAGRRRRIARAYHGLFDPFYRGAFDAGLQVRILHAGQLTAERRGADSPPDGIPSWSSPALYVADDATLDWLADYADAGGHLVLGPRTALRRPRGPGPRRGRSPRGSPRQPASGTTSSATSATTSRVTATDGSPLDLPDGRRQRPAGPTVCSRTAPTSSPATTTRTSAAGRRSPPGHTARAGSPTSAPYRTRTLAAALFRWLVRAGDAAGGPYRPSVTVTGATARDGRRLRFVHNWSWEPATVRLPAPFTTRSAPSDHDAGAELTLGRVGRPGARRDLTVHIGHPGHPRWWRAVTGPVSHDDHFGGAGLHLAPAVRPDRDRAAKPSRQLRRPSLP